MNRLRGRRSFGLNALLNIIYNEVKPSTNFTSVVCYELWEDLIVINVDSIILPRKKAMTFAVSRRQLYKQAYLNGEYIFQENKLRDLIREYNELS